MSGLLTLSQHTSHPAIPTTGNEHLYFYSDGKLYRMEDDGVPVEVGAAGSSGATHAMVEKSADESVTSSATLQDDDHLFFAIGTSEKWAFEFTLFFTGPTAIFFTPTLAVPSGFTRLGWSAVAYNSVTTAKTTTMVTASNTTVNIQPATTNELAVIKGSIVNGATPGNVQLRWAQSSSNATPITIKAGSHLIAHQIA